MNHKNESADKLYMVELPKNAVDGLITGLKHQPVLLFAVGVMMFILGFHSFWCLAAVILCCGIDHIYLDHDFLLSSCNDAGEGG